MLRDEQELTGRNGVREWVFPGGGQLVRGARLIVREHKGRKRDEREWKEF